MPFFRTILGNKQSEEMGITYSHEHFVIDDCFATAINPEFLLNNKERIMDELTGLKALGCSTMVDTMPVNAGRNVLLSAEISKATGINFILPTGIHLEIYYPPSHWRFHYSEDQLTQLFIADIEEGIDIYDFNGPVVQRTSHKAGLLKLATADESFSKHQEMIFRAVVNAHRQTGAPILTHTNFGKQALAQAELFHKLGADLRHVVLSHTDRNKDLDTHHALLQTGVSVECDSAFRWKEGEENWTYTLLEKLLSQYPPQITVGMDAAKSSYWRSYCGKPGLDYLLTTFKEELQKRNIHSFFDNLFITNPSRIFSFEHPEKN